MLSLQDAVVDLYRIAVSEKRRTSTKRLSRLAALCIQELDVRGIAGAKAEVTVPGIGRNKQWDVAWSHNGRVRLGISLKSILKNVAGSVPNRVDDLMGEMANVQLYSPEIVTGYIMILNTENERDRQHSCAFRCNVERLTGRKAPAWAVGMVEASAVVEVDFSTDCTLFSPPDYLEKFFDSIANSLRQRNPSLGK